MLIAGMPSFALGSSTPMVAVLPLAAADTGVPYGLLPSGSELDIMTSEVRAGLRDAGVALVPRSTIARTTTASGYDQSAPIHSCVVAECARKIGREVHADKVVIGAVTREMAVVWGTEFSIVDVRTGKVVSEMNAGYKGDVQAMEQGDRDAGACIARTLEGKPSCREDRGW
jgi:hypothetical protein